MSRLSQGDRAAFDPLFRALHPRAFRLARVRLDEDQASDAAQSILMKVFARASEFEAGRPALPWFYAVASNEIRTLERRRAAAAGRAADEKRARRVEALEDPERLLLDRELRRCLDAAVASLDQSSAEAIACLLDEGPRPDLRAPTFRKRLSRAYARLRVLLGELDAK